MSLGINRFTLNRFLQIWKILTLSIPILYILLIPILTDTNFFEFSERSVQYLAQTRFKLKIGVSLADPSVFWITRKGQIVLFFSISIILCQAKLEKKFDKGDQTSWG